MQSTIRLEDSVQVMLGQALIQLQTAFMHVK